MLVLLLAPAARHEREDKSVAVGPRDVLEVTPRPHAGFESGLDHLDVLVEGLLARRCCVWKM